LKSTWDSDGSDFVLLFGLFVVMRVRADVEVLSGLSGTVGNHLADGYPANSAREWIIRPSGIGGIVIRLIFTVFATEWK
jgi:hypothetical protein